MSVFVTTLGATDNEICAPISQCIINTLTPKGFRFKGIPAVEANIHLKDNRVEFRLRSCCLQSSPFSLSFDEVSNQTLSFRHNRLLDPNTQQLVRERLDELNKSTLPSGGCKENSQCINCVLNQGLS